MVLLGYQNPVVRSLQQWGHGQVDGVLSLDGRIRLEHAQVVRGADTTFPDLGQQRRYFLDIHRWKISLEPAPSTLMLRVARDVTV